MDNKILEEIKDFAVQKLKDAYGYCGLAISSEFALLNSDDRKGNDITITIKSKKG